MKKFNLMSRIPVAIISGDETRETRKKVYEYDIVDMLEKPFNVQVVRHRIENFITLYNANNSLNEVINPFVSFL